RGDAPADRRRDRQLEADHRREQYQGELKRPCAAGPAPRSFDAKNETNGRAALPCRERERTTMMKRRDFLLASGGLVAAPFVKTSAFAADYPTKAVHWIVGYVPGGTTDILARLIGAYLSEKTGQQFIIENKAGAGNNLAVEAVLAAPADGYNVLLVNPANGINTTLYKKLPFNFVRDI